MANLYENIPEMDQQRVANEQRRKIAEAMLAQSQENVQPFSAVPGGYVVPMSWTQGLAQLVKHYVANRDIRKANEGDAGLAKQYQDKSAQAVTDYQRMAQGSPEVPPAAITPAGVGPARPAQGPPQPAVQGDPRAAMIALLANQYAPPEAKQAAIMGETWRRDDLNREEERAARKDNLLISQQTRLAEIEARMQDRQLTRDQQADLAREGMALRSQIAQMTGAMSRQVAPSYAEIIDPKDPTRMLKIDGRLYKPGGSLGDAGVIGVSGKEPTAATAETKRGTSQDSVTGLVVQLKDLYKQLANSGGMVDPANGVISNTTARVASSGLGQYVGGVAGTQNQSLRDTIVQMRPQLLNAIRQASGMSARAIDSNAELKLWLDAVSDPTRSLPANMAILDNIDQQYGAGAKQHGGASGDWKDVP